MGTPHEKLYEDGAEAGAKAGAKAKDALTDADGNFLGVYNTEGRLRTKAKYEDMQRQERADAQQAEFDRVAEGQKAKDDEYAAGKKVRVADNNNYLYDGLPPILPRPGAVPGQDPKAAPKQVAGDTLTTTTSREIVNVRDETLAEEEMARQATFAAATEEARVRSQYAGMQADLTEEVLGNIKEVDDEVAQLWDVGLKQQESRLQSMQQMIEAGRNRMADPTAFFSSQGEAAGFAAGAAVAAGHLANALGGGPNTALKVIDSAIERNLRAQEFNIRQQNFQDQQQANLFDRWNGILKDKVQARLMAKHSLIQQMEFQLSAQAARMEGDMAGVQLQQVRAALATQKAGLMRQVDLLNKKKVSSTFKRVLPLATAQRDARMAASQPEVSTTAVPGSAPTALTSSMQGTKRVAYDTGASFSDGTPASIASPEVIAEEGAPMREVSPMEMYQEAYNAAEGEDSDKRRAAGQALRQAGMEELQAIHRRQSQGEEMTETDLYNAWQNSPTLQATVPNWQDLALPDPSRRIRVGAVGKEYINDPVREKAMGVEAARDARATIPQVVDYVSRDEEVRDLVRSIKPSALDAARVGGKIVWAKLDKDTKQKIEQIKRHEKAAFQVVRAAYNSGALQGPGEAQLFEEMSIIPDKYDGFVDLLGDQENALAMLDERRDMMQEIGNRTENLLGYRTGKHMFRAPEEIGNYIEADQF